MKKAVLKFLNFIKSHPKFKPLNQGLQSALGWWITNCGNSGLQIVATVDYKVWQQWITKCGKMDYKVWQDYKVG